MRYYAITGRLIGDDEDVPFLVGQQPDLDAARQAFINMMCEYRDRDPDEVNFINMRDGEMVYITSAFASDTPITTE